MKLNNYQLIIITICGIIILCAIFKKKKYEGFVLNPQGLTCNNSLDSTNDTSSICKKFTHQSVIDSMITTVIDKPQNLNYVSKILLRNYNHGKTEGYKKYSNTRYSGKVLRYLRVYESDCQKLADANQNAAGFVSTSNGDCYIQGSMTNPKKTINTNSYIKGRGSQFTISLWFNITRLTQKERILFIMSDGGNNFCPKISLSPNGTSLGIYVTTDYNISESIILPHGDISINRWTHVTVVLIGKELSVFIDGELNKRSMLNGNPNFPKNLNLYAGNSKVYSGISIESIQLSKLLLNKLAVSQNYIKNILLKNHPQVECNQRPATTFCKAIREDFAVSPIGKIIKAGKDDSHRLLDLTENWTYDDSMTQQYRRPSVDIYQGIVFVTGTVKGTPNSGTITTLPEGFRPNKRLMFHVGTNKGVRLDVYPDGNIMYVTGNSGNILSLDGIFFTLTSGSTLNFMISRKAHYVRIILPGSNYLQLAEVKVYDEHNNLISKDKKARHTSSYNQYTKADKALDGRTDGGRYRNSSSNTIAITRRKNNNFWMINLGKGYNISKVEVYNRTDRGTDHRITGAKVQLLDKERNEIVSRVWDPNDYKDASKISRTRSGRTCQRWSSGYPHRHWYRNIKGIRGRSGAIIDRFEIISEGGDVMYKHGYSNGGGAFNFMCPKNSTVKSIRYNPFGWWGRYSWMGGLGPITCTDGTVLNRQGKGNMKRRLYTWRTIDWKKRYGLGNHNYCRNLGSRNLWCITNDRRRYWDLCTVNGTSRINYKTKIYPKMKTFTFNMKGGKVHSGWSATSNEAMPMVAYTDEFVVISGLINYKRRDWPVPSVIAELPEKARPKFAKVFNVNNHNGSAKIVIDPSGALTVVAANKYDYGRYYGWLNLNGIIYSKNDQNSLSLMLNKEFEITSQMNNQQLMSGAVYKLRLFKGNGQSTGIDEGDDDSFKITGDQSLSMWLTVSPNGRQNPIYKSYRGEMGITIESNGSFHYYCGRGSSSGSYFHINSGKRLEYNVPTHIAVVRKSNSVNIYINGKVTASKKLPFIVGSTFSPLMIGRGYVRPFKGEINNLFIFNRALSGTEINKIKAFVVGEDNNYGPPKVHKSEDLITLSGVVKSKESDPGRRVIANLPGEYRPNRTLTFAQNYGDKSHSVIIQDNGDIINVPSDSFPNAQISLDGITFLKFK